MADTTTATLGLTKIEVGASEDTWGAKINTNMDTLESFLSGASNLSALKTSGDVTVGGELIASAGTAAAPSITFTGDVNTGIYQAAADQVGVSVAGANIATFDATNGLLVGGSRVYRRANILGTVSESSGVPTGAIIEEGSNANGDYTKFADGTMICTMAGNAAGNCINASGALYNNTGLSWTFPATFASAPVVTGRVAGSTQRWCNCNATTTTTATFAMFSTVSSMDILGIHAIAIGRWF